MTWPTGVIIDTLFIPLYTLLLLLNFLNVLKHGHRRNLGFISLLLVSLLHLTGNLLLVIEYNHHYSNINVTVWGYILQSIGMSFLVSASLAFFSRARTAIRAGGDGVVRWVRLGNLVNLVALVCVVTGYSTTSFTNARGEVLDRVSLPVQTKIGAVLYVVLSVAIFSATVLFLRAGGEGDRCTRIIKGALVVATPLMLFRSSWSVYTVEEGSLLHPKNIWVKLVLQYVAEFAALVVLTAVGFGVGNVREEGWDVEDGDGYGQKPLVQQTYGYQQQQQTVPMTYPPPPPPQQ